MDEALLLHSCSLVTAVCRRIVYPFFLAMLFFFIPPLKNVEGFQKCTIRMKRAAAPFTLSDHSRCAAAGVSFIMCPLRKKQEEEGRSPITRLWLQSSLRNIGGFRGSYDHELPHAPHTWTNIVVEVWHLISLVYCHARALS